MENDAHFEGKEVGSIYSLPEKMYNVPFHMFAMKEFDHVMKLMGTYGTNELQLDHSAKKAYLRDGKEFTKDFHYPEVMIMVLNDTHLYVLNMFGQQNIGNTARSLFSLLL